MHRTLLTFLSITLLCASNIYSDQLLPNKPFNNDKTPEEELDTDYQTKRFKYWLVKAEKGDPHAMFISAYYYERGLGVKQNLDKAYDFYSKSAQNNYVKAYLKMAAFPKPLKAVKLAIKPPHVWYQKAIDEEQNPQAMLKLSLLHFHGKGVKKDKQKAIKLMIDSAKLDNLTAMIYLGNYYQRTEDYDSSLKWFRRAAKRGSEYALFRLGLYYESAKNKNYQMAYKHYLKAAKLGYCDAMVNIGILYERGNLGEPNYLEAMKWYKKASLLNNTTAHYNLAIHYEFMKKFDLSFKHLSQAVKLGDNGACLALGKYYKYGKGNTKKDLEKAYELISKALQANNRSAMYELAGIYRNKAYKNYDPLKAIKWYKAAAKQSHDNAMVRLALIYELGDGVTTDEKKAIFWYQKASKLNNAIAAFNLALIYENNQDFSKAYNQYQQAAKNGDVDALIKLGDYHLEGITTTRSIDKAKAFYIKAARLNHPIASYKLAIAYINANDDKSALVWLQKSAKNGHSDAICELAQFYENGRAVQANSTIAYNYYLKAAEQDHPHALYKLASYLEEGLVVERNYNKALKYYYKATEFNYPKAFSKIAHFYKNGLGVQVNLQKAFNNYAKGSKEGAVEATYELAICYEKGLGTRVNIEKAFYYYLKASKLNHRDAMLKVADYYERGINVEQSQSKAKKWRLKSKTLVSLDN